MVNTGRSIDSSGLLSQLKSPRSDAWKCNLGKNSRATSVPVRRSEANRALGFFHRELDAKDAISNLAINEEFKRHPIQASTLFRCSDIL